MGCWNATCGISNLHIKENDEVYVFVLEKVKNPDSLCYSTAFYKPLMLPFYAKYNDYGAGYDCTGVALPLIMDIIKKSLVELEVGDNQYHDIAVTREDFNEELFFESIHENRLFVKGYYGNTNINMVMMRKDIIDHIIENWVQSDYVGSEKGTSGYDNSYIKYKFSDILGDIPTFISRIQAYHKKESDVVVKIEFFDSFSSIFGWDDENKVSKYIQGDSHRFSRLVYIERLIYEAVIQDDIEYATKIIEDHLKARYVACFMDSTRKSWLPGAHQGSQSQDHDGYNVLISAMTDALANERKRWDEDE